MAEIKIEKKKPIWPWILLVLVLLAVVAYFVYADNESDDYTDDINSEEIDDMDDGNMNDSITYNDTADYSDSAYALTQYNESIKDSTRIGMDSTYTKSALHNLSKAVTSKAAQYNLESSNALEALKKYSDNMNGMYNSEMTDSNGASQNFKSISENIATVLESIQMKNFPTLNKEVMELKQSTTKITTSTLDKQQAALQSFFRKANEVLNKMNS